MKSRTCFSKHNGSPLSEYFSKTEAESATEYLAKSIGIDMVPYRCEKCEYWHLSPKVRFTPTTKCHYCCGSDGRAKDSYRSFKKARNRADILFQEKGIRLNAYRCEYGSGWHLTKKML